MSKQKAEHLGQCMVCKEVVKKSQMTRHLKKCAAANDAGTGPSVKFFHLVIEGSHTPMYWLHVEIPGAMTLADLDSFLRGIWLECCGHLSSFTIEGELYSVQPEEYQLFGMREQSMQQKIYKILSVGTKFQHEYDYGSTTKLKLRVVAVHQRQVKKPDLVLLARNQPPVWTCTNCGKPATQVQASGWGMDADSLFCDDCMADDNEYRFLPIANSPRTGVCGYC